MKFLINTLKYRVLCIVVIACITASTSADELGDVKGWQNTYWGMSPQELRSVYGDQLHIESNSDGNIYTIKNYSLFSHPFEVQFFWKDGVHLSQVLVSVGIAQVDLSNLPGKILSSLSGKYGEGKIIENKVKKSETVFIGKEMVFSPGSTRINVKWTYPSTLIEYRFSTLNYETGRYVSMLSISYEENEESKL